MEGHMINNRGMARAGAILACGTALLAITGCSSHSSGPSAAGGATGATATAATSPSTSAPSWASTLGSGVTVVAPETAAPGHDSPGAVVTGFFDALNAKKYVALCSYLIPGTQSGCRTLYGAETPGSLAKIMPFAKNVRLGYIAIDGMKALIGTTGEFCSPLESPECSTNNSPAAILNSGKSFSALWTTAAAEASNSSGPAAYMLFPCQEVGGKWYLADSSS
jgi:hypothetical protein